MRQIPSTHQYHSAYGYQTRQDGELPWVAPALKVTQPFDHVVLIHFHNAYGQYGDIPRETLTHKFVRLLNEVVLWGHAT